MPDLSQDPFEIVERAIASKDLTVLNELKNLLRRRSVDVNAWCDEVTLLGMVAEAGDLDLVQMMIEQGADVNLSTNSDTATALMQAASGGSLQIVKLLIASGANVNEVKGGDSALTYAFYSNHQDVFDYLYPLTKAALRQKIEKIGLVSNRISIEKELSPSEIELFEAITVGDSVRVDQIINFGVNINILNEEGHTPISYAAELARFDIVHILIDAGADPNLMSSIKSPAIITAAGYGDAEIVRVLIASGAEVNALVEQRNALMQAAEWAPLEAAQQIIQQLIEAGASLDIEDKHGNTALILAAEKNRTSIVEMLQQFGASDAKLSGILLLEASDKGDVEQVQSLIKTGVDVNIKSSDGYSPVACAAAKGYIEILSALIEAGADIEAREYRGYTPLMLAVGKGHIETIRLLIQAGADVDVRDDVSRSIIDHAQEAALKKNVRREILQLLREEV